MATAYVFDALYLEHDEPTHPENGRRLQEVMAHLRSTRLLDRLTSLPARDALPEELAAVHRPAYIEEIRASAEGRIGWLDADTYLGPMSYAAAVRAAGGLLAAVDAVLQKDVTNAFALVRPPGHHAVAGRAMGFCLFNNVAIAARYVLQKHALQRVLIVDFDLHHGNGTQDAFYEDPGVLYFSTHQYPYYPGTGHYQELGRGAGYGYNANVPLPAGVGDVGYERVFEEILTPLARRYHPQCILVSAGYDAHWADPLGMMSLSISGFAALTRSLVTLADELCAGRLVFTLEGGYNLNALAQGVGATFATLLGDSDVPDLLGPAQGHETPIEHVIHAVKEAHQLA